MRSALKLVSSENINPVAGPSIEIVETQARHIRDLMENIRPEDRREIEAVGMYYKKGIWQSFKRGIMNHTALIDGKVAACWGVGGSYMGQTAQPYLLTTDEVKKVSPLKFARIYQLQVLEMLEIAPVLENYVLASYTESRRLLEICGFTLGDPEPIGPKKTMFCKFRRER